MFRRRMALFLGISFSLTLFNINQACLAGEATIDVAKLRFTVIKKELPNGLTVLLHEDHSAPLVSYHTWFRVGSKYEQPGFTGIAHLFEHMMFKGAKRYSGKEFDRLLQSNGISNNAFTTYDYTGYYEDLPSDKLRLVMDIESDRMVNLALTPENLKSEREVVKEERRMRVDNSLMGQMNEKLWSEAYKVHPYKWPVIGWMTDIDAITLERCLDFYKTYYSVSNAVLVIAGDIDIEKTLAMVTEFYGPLPKVEVPKLKLEPEPPQKAERKAQLKKPTQTEQMAIAYHIGKAGDDDSYVLDIISNILTEGQSSRLYKKLVYLDQNSLAAEGASMTPQDPGLFQVFVELKPKMKADRVLGLAVYEIESLSRRGVTKQELEKAKNQIMKHWVDSMKSIHGKANSLALNEVVTGSYDNLFADLARYQKVSLADVKKVAGKYLTPANRTVVTLVAEKGAKK